MVRLREAPSPYPLPSRRERRKVSNATAVRTRLGDARANEHPARVLTAEVKSIGYVNPEPRTKGLASMKTTARFCSPAHAGSFVLAFLVGVALGTARAQNEPILVPEAVNYQKLLPILPEPPQGWTADKPEGSTEDVGGFKITNVHRDYHQGDGEKAPTAAISIVDLVANPDNVSATTDAWKNTSESAEGYSKSVTIDGNPAFEAFEKESRHATLWVMIANRYSLQIELQNQDPKELQQWIKRVDLKKLAAIK